MRTHGGNLITGRLLIKCATVHGCLSNGYWIARSHKLQWCHTVASLPTCCSCLDMTALVSYETRSINIFETVRCGPFSSQTEWLLLNPKKPPQISQEVDLSAINPLKTRQSIILLKSIAISPCKRVEL
jgi:hypothetical protein